MHQEPDVRRKRLLYRLLLSYLWIAVAAVVLPDGTVMNSMASQLDDHIRAVTRRQNELQAVLVSMVDARLDSDSEQQAAEIPFDLPGMWSKAQAMLRDSLDALVTMNAKLANDVCARDDEVDRIKRDFRVHAEKLIL